jgi:hypothetical protein
MQEEMHVGVDQAGEQRDVAEVDDFGALRMVDRCADGANAVAFDQDFAGLEEGAGVDLEQARGVEDDGRSVRGDPVMTQEYAGRGSGRGCRGCPRRSSRIPGFIMWRMMG